MKCWPAGKAGGDRPIHAQLIWPEGVILDPITGAVVVDILTDNFPEIFSQRVWSAPIG